VDWLLKTGGENFDEFQKSMWKDLPKPEESYSQAVLAK
jgi:hypothetical protein